MDPSQKNAFGRTAVQVTAMGYGAAPIGNIFRPISEQESQNMIMPGVGQRSALF